MWPLSTTRFVALEVATLLGILGGPQLCWFWLCCSFSSLQWTSVQLSLRVSQGPVSTAWITPQSPTLRKVIQQSFHACIYLLLNVVYSKVSAFGMSRYVFTRSSNQWSIWFEDISAVKCSMLRPEPTWAISVPRQCWKSWLFTKAFVLSPGLATE